MTPQDIETLKKYTAVAKKIIFEPNRFKQFLQMLGTPEGAIQAASTVISAIEKHKPVPGHLLEQLAMNTYLVMVELARDVTGHTPDPEIMKRVMTAIRENISKMSGAQPAQQPQQEQPMPQQGLVGARMGAPA